MFQPIKILFNKLPIGQAVSVSKKYWSQLLVFAITATGCCYLWSPAAPKPETSKPEVEQADGSIVVERAPDPEAHAAMLLPKGAKLQRKITVTVQAKNPIQTISGTVTVEETKSMMKSADMAESPKEVSDAGIPISVECPPVTLDLALVKMPDDSQRVLASSPDGIILAAMDIPVESAKPTAEPKKWAVGAVIDPFRQTFGGFVDRDVAFLRLGVQINQRDQGDIPNQIWAKVGLKF